MNWVFFTVSFFIYFFFDSLINNCIHNVNVQKLKILILIKQLCLSVSGSVTKTNVSTRSQIWERVEQPIFEKNIDLSMLICFTCFDLIPVTSGLHRRYSKFDIISLHFRCFKCKLRLEISFTVNIISIISFKIKDVISNRLIHVYENGWPFCCYNNKSLVFFIILGKIRVS